MQNFLFTLLLYLFSTIFLNIEFQRQSKKVLFSYDQNPNIDQTKEELLDLN